MNLVHGHYYCSNISGFPVQEHPLGPIFHPQDANDANFELHLLSKVVPSLCTQATCQTALDDLRMFLEIKHILTSEAL